MAIRGYTRRMARAARMPSSVWRGRHPDVGHDQVGLVLGHGGQELLAVAHRGNRSKPASASRRTRPAGSSTESSAITTRTAAPR